MIIWKRKKGQSVVIGSGLLCSVRKVLAGDGTEVEGAEVSLGFVTPGSIRVQRAEKYKADMEENLEFPLFYRQVQRGSDRVAGYALELPGEIDRRSDGFDYQPIAGYEDMTQHDDRVQIHLFHSEGEALAFTLGLDIMNDRDNIGHVRAARGNLWAVLVHFFYTAYGDSLNPEVHDHLGRTTQLEEALKKYA